MSAKLLHFPRWAEVLKNSSMPEKDKENHRIILLWYLGWCQKCAVGCSVDSARAFVKPELSNEFSKKYCSVMSDC